MEKEDYLKKLEDVTETADSEEEIVYTITASDINEINSKVERIKTIESEIIRLRANSSKPKVCIEVERMGYSNSFQYGEIVKELDQLAAEVISTRLSVECSSIMKQLGHQFGYKYESGNINSSIGHWDETFTSDCNNDVSKSLQDYVNESIKWDGESYSISTTTGNDDINSLNKSIDDYLKKSPF